MFNKKATRVCIHDSIKKIVKCKRSQIAAGMAWIVATLLIFFIMLVYTVAMVAVGARTKIFSQDMKTAQLSSADSFLDFLKQDVEVSGKNMKVYELFGEVKEKGAFGDEAKNLNEELSRFVEAGEYECSIASIFEAAYTYASGWDRIKSGSIEFQEPFLSEKGSSVIFIYRDKLIKIRYYFGKC